MNLLKRINSTLETKGTQNTAGLMARQNRLPQIFDNAKRIGDEITLYPHKDGENIIQYGYNMNATVNSCIRIIQKMFGKVPFYVVKIKAGEQKNWQESQILMKSLHDHKAVHEAKQMRKKAMDSIITEDNPLHKFLNKPNRYQSGSMFREQLIGYKKLTGEGNTWFNRGKNDDGSQSTQNKPSEMFIIPKYALNLVGNKVDPWEIVRYEMILAGARVDTPKKNILMWNETNYNFDPLMLTHMRGISPLEAALLQIQSLNESSIREIKEALNGGANGLLFRKDAKELPKDPNTTSSIRNQINNAVNGQDVAGTIAWLAGEWGYLPFGKTSVELQRLELSVENKDDVCNVLGVPPGMLKSDQTYQNDTAMFRRFIYSCIAPEAYSLRDAWNTTLLEMFGLDPNRYAIDCDPTALPELAQDVKDIAAGLDKAWGLSVDQRLIAMGYEPIGGEQGKMVLVPSGLQTLDELNMGGNTGLEPDEEL